ncbi:MAG: hypothetical protein LBR15_04115 [Methanobrevibacter sp.]|nr:hypothetical protein [Candidatus Methanovirga australis]
MKRFLSIFLIVIMLSSMVPCNAIDAYDLSSVGRFSGDLFSMVSSLSSVFDEGNVSNANNSSSVNNIAASGTTIQEMVDNANPGDVIELEDRVYNEWNIRVNKNVTIKAKAGANPIVNGNKKGSVFVLSSDAVINGITVIGGYLSGGAGAGVYNDGGSIINCTIKNNVAEKPDFSSKKAYGAGVYNDGGSIINCTIRNNVAERADGAGVYNNGGSIIDCIIQNNEVSSPWYVRAENSGGGVYNNGGFVTNCMIMANTADRYGGGVYNNGVVTDCNISE